MAPKRKFGDVYESTGYGRVAMVICPGVGSHAGFDAVEIFNLRGGSSQPVSWDIPAAIEREGRLEWLRRGDDDDPAAP